VALAPGPDAGKSEVEKGILISCHQTCAEMAAGDAHCICPKSGSGALAIFEESQTLI